MARFKSLKNAIEEITGIEKHTASSIEDDFFGELRHNAELDWFEVEKDEIEYSFANTSPEELILNLRKIENLFPRLNAVKDSMIQDMLTLKNESRLEDDEDELSVEEFEKEIQLYAINTYEDGSAELYYRANDLFWGHEIQASIDIDQKYESSTIVG